MATGQAWDISNPLKPVALFDPNATRDIPFDWTLWTADIDDTYASHSASCDPQLQIVTSAYRSFADGGTATGGSSETLIDTGKDWEANRFVRKTVSITAGTGIGQTGLIVSNTAETLTIRDAWAIAPDATSIYVIKATIIIVRVRADPAGSAEIGQKYGLTCRITSTGGQVDDQTVFLKIAQL